MQSLKASYVIEGYSEVKVRVTSWCVDEEGRRRRDGERWSDHCEGTDLCRGCFKCSCKHGKTKCSMKCSRSSWDRSDVDTGQVLVKLIFNLI